MDYVKMVSLMMEPLRRRLSTLVARAIIENVKDSDGLHVMKLQTATGEAMEDVQQVGIYGLTSKPKKGAEAVILSLGGNRDHSIVIACDDRRFRLQGLAEGEVALYTDEGDKIHFKRGRKIEVTTETFEVNCKKAAIKNSSGDFVATVAAVLDEVMAAKTSTAIGPQPLIGPNFAALKTKLDSFKTG